MGALSKVSRVRVDADDEIAVNTTETEAIESGQHSSDDASEALVDVEDSVKAEGQGYTVILGE